MIFCINYNFTVHLFTPTHRSKVLVFLFYSVVVTSLLVCWTVKPSLVTVVSNTETIWVSSVRLHFKGDPRTYWIEKPLTKVFFLNSVQIICTSRYYFLYFAYRYSFAHVFLSFQSFVKEKFTSFIDYNNKIRVRDGAKSKTWYARFLITYRSLENISHSFQPDVQLWLWSKKCIC